MVGNQRTDTGKVGERIRLRARVADVAAGSRPALVHRRRPRDRPLEAMEADEPWCRELGLAHIGV